MLASSNTLGFFPSLPYPDEIRTWDMTAEANGYSGNVLMENAARCALDTLLHYMHTLEGKKIIILMGSGNNGGDAACLARYLYEHGSEITVFHTCSLEKYGESASYHVKLAQQRGIKFVYLHSDFISALKDDMPYPDIMIDGLLGTGFRGQLRRDAVSLIEQFNFIAQASRCFVLSLDIPSGLDGRTGVANPVAIRASATITFAAAKAGMLSPGASIYTGKLHLGDIGLPLRGNMAASSTTYLIDAHCLKMLPPLPREGYKNSFGHVLVIGGAGACGGAAHLASRAALRIGAGLVTAIAPDFTVPYVKNDLAEIMVIGAGHQDPQKWPDSLPDYWDALIGQCSSMVIGPGFGRDDCAMRFFELILSQYDRPDTVFDADALILLSQKPQLMKFVRETDVLTPHPGEAGALLGQTSAAVQSDRYNALNKLCRLTKGTVVLKGAGTLVSNGDKIFLCPYDITQLSVGGAGDVLAGIIGGLIGQRPQKSIPNLLLAAIGVCMHALAGIEVASKYHRRGNLASEISDCLPYVIGKYTGANDNHTNNMLPWPELR